MAETRVEKWIPGLRTIRTYEREWFRSDLVAGLSVAAVALPIGIAYGQLAGFPPVVGIYSCILPAVAYALFGSSRQLVVNPDAAACAIVAATVVPLAAGDPARYWDLSIVLTAVTGVMCIAGGLAGFGVIANFLSRPILTGYLNGIALSIIASQLGTLFGFKIASGGFFRTVGAAITRIGETHRLTFIVGFSLFVLLRLLKHLAPKLPAPLIAAVLGIAAVYFLSLSQQGVSVVGAVPAGFPAPHLPAVQPSDVTPLLFGAAGIVLVSFCSMMTTARGFAAKNGYQIDSNQDMIALGVSDLASALNRGFVVSGADSRTAVADGSGGKTQVTTLVAAVVMALVLLFLTGPLAYVPTVALAAILISSAMGLFDFESMLRYRRTDRAEFRFAVVAMLGVMTIGVLPGVIIAVALTLLRLLRMASNPHEAILGPVEGHEGIFESIHTERGKPIPGIVIFRFDSALLFFNADHFKDRVRNAIDSSETRAEWLVLNAEAVPILDITGADALDELRSELASHNTVMVITRPKGFFRMMLERSGVAGRVGEENVFPSTYSAIASIGLRSANGAKPAEE
jgi:high affinity sulfate transporter 1